MVTAILGHQPALGLVQGPAGVGNRKEGDGKSDQLNVEDGEQHRQLNPHCLAAEEEDAESVYIYWQIGQKEGGHDAAPQFSVAAHRVPGSGVVLR